jgi:hypothetical protein
VEDVALLVRLAHAWRDAAAPWRPLAVTGARLRARAAECFPPPEAPDDETLEAAVACAIARGDLVALPGGYVAAARPWAVTWGATAEGTDGGTLLGDRIALPWLTGAPTPHGDRVAVGLSAIRTSVPAVAVLAADDWLRALPAITPPDQDRSPPGSTVEPGETLFGRWDEALVPWRRRVRWTRISSIRSLGSSALLRRREGPWQHVLGWWYAHRREVWVLPPELAALYRWVAWVSATDPEERPTLHWSDEGERIALQWGWRQPVERLLPGAYRPLFQALTLPVEAGQYAVAAVQWPLARRLFERLQLTLRESPASSAKDQPAALEIDKEVLPQTAPR